MAEDWEQWRDARDRVRCQVDYLLGESSPPCPEPAEEEVDGLLLCGRHALIAKLEGQIECWDGMLWHIDLWSGEASRQNRRRAVDLLDAERSKAMVAIARAREDLDALREERKVRGRSGPGSGRRRVI